MKVDIKFKGIDYWNRPVFKTVDKNVYIGSTTILFPDKELAPNNTPEEISEYFRNNKDKLCIFGDSFNCEPLGYRISKEVELNIIR